jgi:tetratricopeptide (TPR) repeat protein
MRAFLAMSRHDVQGAIAMLEPVRKYELVRSEVIELRANAYMAAGQWENAARENEKLIANPGLGDPMLPRTLLAHVGRARALTRLGRLAEARTEYETFFEWMDDGDPDLPVLKEARAEYAALGHQPVA